VTLHRSPTLTKLRSGVNVKTSSPGLNHQPYCLYYTIPDRRRYRGSTGILRGGASRSSSPIAFIVSGVVPQQPPAMLIRPSVANPLSSRHPKKAKLEGAYTQIARSDSRSFIVSAHSIWQSSIRIAVHVALRSLGYLLQKDAHLHCTKRTIQSDAAMLWLFYKQLTMGVQP
jgi:hypothetical protein